MERKLFIWSGSHGCNILVWHVAFLCTQWCPAMYQLFSTGMSPGLWHLTFSCSHTCAMAQPTCLSQSQKAGGAHAWQRPEWQATCSPSAVNTSVCLEISSPGYNKQELDGASRREVACSFLQKEIFRK